MKYEKLTPSGDLDSESWNQPQEIQRDPIPSAKWNQPQEPAVKETIEPDVYFEPDSTKSLIQEARALKQSELGIIQAQLEVEKAKTEGIVEKAKAEKNKSLYLYIGVGVGGLILMVAIMAIMKE